MSEQDEGDPYLEYQQILGKAQDEIISSQTAKQVQLKRLQQREEGNEQKIILIPCKKLISPQAEPIILISGQAEKHFDETVKRSHMGKFMSPQHVSKSEQVRSDIRMKLILENGRLKGNVDSLRKDLAFYRTNQLKIGQILKESREKIMEYKQLIKDKSKKISELTDSKLQLKGKVNSLEEKINQLNSYCNWQEGHIRDLKKELSQKNKQKWQVSVLQQKIEKLEVILKNYQIQILRQEEQKSNTFSKSSYEGEIGSSEHINDRPSQHWGTMNELEFKDVEGMKHKEPIHEEEYEMLSEANSHLRMRLKETELELQATKNELKKRQEEWQILTKQNLLKIDSLDSEVKCVVQKSLNMDSKIQEKDQFNSELSMEIQKLKTDIDRYRFDLIESQKHFKAQLEQLGNVVTAKDEIILQLNHKLRESQTSYRKEISELEIVMQQNQERFKGQWEEMKEKLDEVYKRNSQLENLQEDYRLKLELERTLKEEQEEREKEARSFLGEKREIQDKLLFFQHQNVKLKEELKAIEQRLLTISEANKFLQADKNQQENELQKYVHQINNLKILLNKLSRNYAGQQESQHPKVIEEQEEQQQGSLAQKDEGNMSEKSEIHSRNEKIESDQVAPPSSRPLSEQEELSEPQDSADGKDSQEIIRLQKQNEDLKKNIKIIQHKYEQTIDRLKEQLRVQLVQIKYKYGQQKEALQGQLNQIKQIVDKKMEIIDNMKTNMAHQQKNREDQVEKLNIFIQNQQLQIKSRDENIIKMEISIERYKHDNAKLQSRVTKLQEENKEYHSQKLKLFERKADLQNQIQKIKYEHQLQASTRSLMYTKQIEKIKNQLEVQIEERYQSESRLLMSQKLQEKQKEIEISSKQKIHQLEIKILELKKNIEMLTETNEVMSSQNKMLKNGWREAEEEKKVLQSKLKSSIEELNNLKFSTEQEKQALQLKFNQKNLQLEKLKIVANKAVELQQAMKNELMIKQEFIMQLERTKSEKQVLKCELESNKSEVLTLRSKLKLLDDEFGQYKRSSQTTQVQIKQKLQTLQRIINQQKSQIQKQFFEKQEIRNSQQKSSKNLSELNEKTKELATEKQTLEREIEELKKMITMFNVELDSIKAEKNDYKLANEELKTRLIEIETEKLCMQSQIQGLLESNRTKDAQLAEKQTSLDNLKVSLELSQTSHAEEVNNLRFTFGKEKEFQEATRMVQIEKFKTIVEELKNENFQLEERHKNDISQFQRQNKENLKEKEELILKNCQGENKLQELSQQLVNLKEAMKIKQEQLQQKLTSITELQSILREKNVASQQNYSKMEELFKQIDQKNKQFSDLKQQHQRYKKTMQDELEIAQKMMQQIEDDNLMKINKLNKDLTHYKLLLEEAQKQNSYRLEQSTHSINQMKNELKVNTELLKQKQEQIKGLKENNNRLKEQLQKIRITSSRFDQQKQQWTKQKDQIEGKTSILAQQVNSLKKDLNKMKVSQESLSEQKIFLQSTIHNLQSQIKELEFKNTNLTGELEKKQFQLMALKEEVITLKTLVQRDKLELEKVSSLLKEEVIQKTKLQYKCEMLEGSIKKLTQDLKKADGQRQRGDQSLADINLKVTGLEQDNKQLKIALDSVEKEHLVRIQNLRSEHRDHYLEMERKYTKEVEQLYQELSKSRNERDNFKLNSEKTKKGEKDLVTQLEQLKEKLIKSQSWLKEYQAQREGQNDRICKLTQENNQMTEVIQSLRTDLMAKNDQIYDLKDQMQRMTEEIGRAGEESSKSIPLSIENDKVIMEDIIQKLEAVNRQLVTKNEILQSQVTEKSKAERELMDKLQKCKSMQFRERKNSGDSWISRNKMFADDKSGSLQNDLEYYKLQLESAQAYITQLEEQNQKLTQSQEVTRIQTLQKRIRQLQKEGEELKMKVEFQQAYIDHLQVDNIQASVISKRSTKSKKMKQHLHVQKDHSVISHDQSQNEKSVNSSSHLLTKIKMINQFIEGYKKDGESMEREEEFRRKLGNHYLDELLNTIFYKLEKESNNLREKQHEIAELEMENQQFQEELKAAKEVIQNLTKKIELYDSVEKKYDETKKMLEQSLMHKLKQQAYIAENKRYIEELEKKNFGHGSKSKYQMMTNSKKKSNQDLSVLKQANEEQQSQSLMSADADSQIPSQGKQSRQAQENVDLPHRPTQSHLLRLNKMLSIQRQLSNQDKNRSIDFLSRILDEIDKIENQIAYLQLDLEEKTDAIAQVIGEEGNKSQIKSKLQEIQNKIKQNSSEMKVQYEREQGQLFSLLREILRFREAQDHYGLQSEKRRRIQQCLNSLQKQFQRTGRYSEEEKVEKIQEGKQSGNSSPLKMILKVINEDITNQDRQSSLVNSKTQVQNSRSERLSHSLEEGMKKENSRLSKEIKSIEEQLSQKQQTIRSMNQVINFASSEINLVLDDILLNSEDNRYLMDQLEGIKKYLSHVFSQESLLAMKSRNPSLEKLNESGKMILMQSKRKETESSGRFKKTNYFQELLRLSNNQFIELGQEMANEHIKTLQKRLEQLVQYRYEDCMDFLINEESLILDILKMSEEESTSEQTMQKLANKFTRQQMANIITNSHNQVEARRILKRVLTEEPVKSESDENDFSPDPQKLQEIRKRIYPHPTELSLSLHNQLISILGAPTRHVFYDLIEQFYKKIKSFEDRIKEQVEEMDSLSQNNSMRMKKLLQDPVRDQDFKQMQKFNLLEYKNHKNRSSSCRIQGSEAHVG